MPTVKIVFYQDEDGRVPFHEFMDTSTKHARKQCNVKIERLHDRGNDLKRPDADYLRDGIYELRFRDGRVHHRLLYFFHGREIVIISHGIIKKDKIPEQEIKKAIIHKQKFELNPKIHTYMDK